MKKAIALVLSTVMCTFVFASCAATNGTQTDTIAEASESASTEATEEPTASKSSETSESTSPEATESASAEASAEASASASADASADVASSSDQALAVFFDTWAEKFDAISSTDGAQQLGAGNDGDIASLIDQAKDWETHLVGHTATIETSSGDVKISATGSDSFQQASVDWKLSVEALANGSSPDLLSFTLASAAMIETVAGGDTNGLVEVNDIMSSVMSMLADIKEDVVKGQPTTIGNGQFGVAVDTKTGTLSLIGTPTAD